MAVKNNQKGLPTWGIVIISVVITLIVVMLIWEVIKKDKGSRWESDWETARMKMDKVMKNDWDKMTGKKVTAGTTGTTTATATPTTAATNTTTSTQTVAVTDLATWLENWQAVDCTITSLGTGAETWYETSANFDQVRFENDNGGLIVNGNWTYIWDNSTMTGLQVQVDVNDVQESLIETLPSANTVGYGIVCSEATSVDTILPSGVDFNQVVTVD